MPTATARREAVRPSRPRQKVKSRIPPFDLKLFLDSAGLGSRVGKFGAGETVIAQGDPAISVMYVQEGGVKLTVVNESGKEAVLVIMGPGDFFGEGCLAGQSICMATAVTIAPTTVLVAVAGTAFRIPLESPRGSVTVSSPSSTLRRSRKTISLGK